MHPPCRFEHRLVAAQACLVAQEQNPAAGAEGDARPRGSESLPVFSWGRMSAFRQLRTLRRTRLCPRSAISGREQMQQTTCATARLFEDLIGGREQRRRYGEA